MTTLENLYYGNIASYEVNVVNLRLLVDSILISEKDRKLNIKINLNAKFQRHKDCYDEEGNLIERILTA